jgi:hypothetical protein
MTAEFPISSPDVIFSYPFGIVTDTHGDVFVTFGLMPGQALDLGGTPVAAGSCAGTLVLAKFDGQTGATLWSKAIVGVDTTQAKSPILLPGDRVAVPVLPEGISCGSGFDGYYIVDPSIAVIDGSGTPAALPALPSPSGVDIRQVAHGSVGWVVGGYYQGSPVIDGIALPPAPAGGGFLGILDETTGKAKAVIDLPNAVWALDVGEDGTMYVGTSTPQPSADTTWWIAAFSPTANPPGGIVWSRSFAAHNCQIAILNSLRARAGVVAVGGSLHCDADFGFGAATAATDTSVLLEVAYPGTLLHGSFPATGASDYPFVDLDPLGGGLDVAGGFAFGAPPVRRLAPDLGPIWSQSGHPGPVAADLHGDVFVAGAHVTAGQASYTLSKYAR